jgi:hypothetical protein
MIEKLRVISGAFYKFNIMSYDYPCAFYCLSNIRCITVKGCLISTMKTIEIKLITIEFDTLFSGQLGGFKAQGRETITGDKR